MIEVKYAETFLKDLKVLKSTPYYSKIKRICFDDIPQCSALSEVQNLKKIEGHKNFFRIRAGDYRIGIHYHHHVAIIRRVLHRKEIYRFFP